AGGAAEAAQLGQTPYRICDVVAEHARDPVVDDLRYGASGVGENRCATGQSLDHHQTERLVPRDGVEQPDGIAQQVESLLAADLAQEVDAVPEQRPDLLLEVLVLRRLVDLGREQQPYSRHSCDQHRLTGAL